MASPELHLLRRCGHCKRLKPVFDKAAREAPVGTRFARVDGSTYRSLSIRYGIEGFPTIFHISHEGSEVRQVNVAHTKEALLAMAQSGYKSVPPLSGWLSPSAPVKKTIFMGIRMGERGAFSETRQRSCYRCTHACAH